MSQDLRQRLERLLQEMLTSLGEEATLEALDTARERVPILATTVEVSHIRGAHYEVVWTFSSGDALRTEMSNLLELQAVQWTLASPPPMMADISLVLRSPALDDLVLRARVVHVHETRVAAQIFCEGQEHALRARPDAIDRAKPAPRAPKSQISLASMMVTPGVGEMTSSSMVLPPSPDEIRQTRTWELGSAGVEPLLLELSRDRATGWLMLRRGEESLRVALQFGSIVEIVRGPSRAGDRLERLLVGAGQLTEEQVQVLEEHARTYACSIADAISDLGMLDHKTLQAALKSRLQYLLKHLWSDGFTFACFGDVPRLQQRYSTPPLSLKRLLFERVYQRFFEDLEAVEHMRSELVGQLLHAPETSTFHGMGLNSRQTRFVEGTLRAPHYLEEFELMSGLGKSDTNVFLLTLHHMGLLSLQESNHATRARKAAFDRLTQMCARVQRDDPYEVLGLHWSAWDGEIDDAHNQILAEHALEEFTDRSEIQEMLLIIQSRAGEAVEKVRKRRMRAQYRDKNVDRFKLQSSVDMFLRQADAAIIRRDLPEAIKYARRVLELQPTHPKPVEFLKRVKALEEKMSAST